MKFPFSTRLACPFVLYAFLGPFLLSLHQLSCHFFLVSFFFLNSHTCCLLIPSNSSPSPLFLSSIPFQIFIKHLLYAKHRVLHLSLSLQGSISPHLALQPSSLVSALCPAHYLEQPDFLLHTCPLFVEKGYTLPVFPCSLTSVPFLFQFLPVSLLTHLS